jgi:hypothetical protein
MKWCIAKSCRISWHWSWDWDVTIWHFSSGTMQASISLGCLYIAFEGEAS